MFLLGNKKFLQINKQALPWLPILSLWRHYPSSTDATCYQYCHFDSTIPLSSTDATYYQYCHFDSTIPLSSTDAIITNTVTLTALRCHRQMHLISTNAQCSDTRTPTKLEEPLPAARLRDASAVQFSTARGARDNISARAPTADWHHGTTDSQSTAPWHSHSSSILGTWVATPPLAY